MLVAVAECDIVRSIEIPIVMKFQLRLEDPAPFTKREAVRVIAILVALREEARTAERLAHLVAEPRTEMLQLLGRMEGLGLVTKIPPFRSQATWKLGATGAEWLGEL